MHAGLQAVRKQTNTMIQTNMPKHMISGHKFNGRGRRKKKKRGESSSKKSKAKGGAKRRQKERRDGGMTEGRGARDEMGRWWRVLR